MRYTPECGQFGILFVCTGNICRSPTADAVARAMVAGSDLAGRVVVDSAGTHGYHIGEPPDTRSIATAKRAGFDLSPLRARKLVQADFTDYDLLIAMDGGHMAHMRQLCPSGARGRLVMFMDYAGADHKGPQDVPDPYYGGQGDFDYVLRLVQDGVAGLLAAVRREILT